MKRPGFEIQTKGTRTPPSQWKVPPSLLQFSPRGVQRYIRFSQIRPNNGDIHYLSSPFTYCLMHHHLSESQYNPLSVFVLIHCQQLCVSFTAFSFFIQTPTQCLLNRRTKLFMSQTLLTLDLLQISFSEYKKLNRGNRLLGSWNRCGNPSGTLFATTKCNILESS